MRRFRGFTFLELIATLGIIILLISITLPIYSRVRQSARSATCRSNLAQLGAALHLYAQDHDGRFPPAPHEWGALFPHVRNHAVLACPSEPARSRKRHLPGGTTGAGEEMRVFSSYQYRAGFANDDDASESLAADWEAWHLGGTNVLYLDGHVAWLPDPRPLTIEERPVPPPDTEPFAAPTFDLWGE
jgi:prepilin-type processing-associated H-X9-DG protein